MLSNQHRGGEVRHHESYQLCESSMEKPDQAQILRAVLGISVVGLQSWAVAFLQLQAGLLR